MMTTGLAQRQTAAHDAIAARLEQLGASVTRSWMPGYDLDTQRFHPFLAVRAVNAVPVVYTFFREPDGRLRVQVGFSCRLSFVESAGQLDYDAIARALLALTTTSQRRAA